MSYSAHLLLAAGSRAERPSIKIFTHLSSKLSSGREWPIFLFFWAILTVFHSFQGKWILRWVPRAAAFLDTTSTGMPLVVRIYAFMLQQSSYLEIEMLAFSLFRTFLDIIYWGREYGMNCPCLKQARALTHLCLDVFWRILDRVPPKFLLRWPWESIKFKTGCQLHGLATPTFFYGR